MSSDAKHRRLSDLRSGEVGVITRVFGHGSFRKRITEMGFVRGKSVKVVKNAPLMDPVEYEIMGYHVALRRSEAHLIEVSTATGQVSGCEPGQGGSSAGNRPGEKTAVTHPGKATARGKAHDATLECQSQNRFQHHKSNIINVALVGNPNSGKTSLFNLASGSHERVGNYSGVTVEGKSAHFNHRGTRINIVDLPGTYSITEYTPEELYVRTHILEQMPDVVINVVDASNLERNLFLTTQLIDMDLKVVVALNMYDELVDAGSKLDYKTLGQMLGIPFVPTVASKGTGIDELFDTVIAVFEENEPMVRHIHINYGDDIEQSILALQDNIWLNSDIVARYSSRYMALKLLEGDRNTFDLLKKVPNYDDIAATAQHESARIEKIYAEKVETVIADAKYGFIAGALTETCKLGACSKNEKASRIDRILTHRWLGIPIFVLIMWIMFQTTFTLGEYPAEWIECGVGWIGGLVRGGIGEGPLRDLLTDGVISGVGGVLVFLPNILLLFFFISILEDTGYMARAAFIMDKLMHKIGLHGKSFIPMLMGFGCNVPAIMATRTLESRKDRILTMLIIPFMSCSARMPVYVLLISTFFIKYQGLIMLSIYAIGIVIAVLSSLLLKKVLFKGSEAPFVMELPPYRIPTTRSVIKHMWNKGSQYLRKMGTVILVASVIVWALGYYPSKVSYSRDFDALRAQVEISEISPEKKAEEIESLDMLQSSERQSNSYIGRMGRFIEPAIRPLGFDWHVGVSLISGIAAKEIIVSSMAVLSSVPDEEVSLSESLRGQRYLSGPKAGEPVYTPLVAYNMMIFILLYFPCFAVFAAIRKEAGTKWAVFAAFYTTAVAWIISLLVYQIGIFF